MKYPTRLHCLCWNCGHQAYVELMLDQVPKLRCAECRARDPVISGRDYTQKWARRRFGKRAARHVRQRSFL